MKKLILLLFIPLVFAFLSCDTPISTEELAIQVKESIIEEIKDKSFEPFFSGIEVIDFTLMHKGGNVYIGDLDIKIHNPEAVELLEGTDFDWVLPMLEKSLKVEVLFDGNNIRWEIVD